LEASGEASLEASGEASSGTSSGASSGASRHAARARAGVPWFVIGFLLAVVVRSTGLLPDPLLDAAIQVSTLLLAAGMFGLGLAIRARELWPLPGRAVTLALAATAVAAV